MTVIIGNSTTRVTWWHVMPIAFTFLVGLVTATWALAERFSGYKQDLQDLKRDVKEIKTGIATWGKKDSVYFAKTDQNTATIDTLKRNSTKYSTQQMALDNRGRPVYYLAHSLAGRLVWFQIKNNN